MRNQPIASPPTPGVKIHADAVREPLLHQDDQTDEEQVSCVVVKREDDVDIVSDEAINTASMYSHDAFDGKRREAPLENERSRWYYFNVKLKYGAYVDPVIIVLWILPFFKEPGWCQKRCGTLLSYITQYLLHVHAYTYMYMHMLILTCTCTCRACTKEHLYPQMRSI